MIHHGQLLKDWADKRKLSAQQIADKRGVNRQSVYQDFTKKSLKINTLETYCKVFDITVNQLLLNVNEIQVDSLWKDRYYNVLENYNKALTVIAQNGIRFDLGKLYNVFAA